MTENSNNNSLSIPVDDDFVEKVQNAIEAALAYEELTKGKRQLPITETVGEILACYELSLRLTSDRHSKGYDAFDANGRRVEIKARRSGSKGLPKDSGRTTTFSEHRFDYALLVILDHQYQIHGIWRASYTKLLPIIEKATERKPHLSSFKKAGRQIFPLNRTRKYHRLPIRGYSDSVRGMVIKRWYEARQPDWNLNETIEVCEEVDKYFLQRSLNPARKFRCARGAKDKHYVSEWVRRCRFPWLEK